MKISERICNTLIDIFFKVYNATGFGNSLLLILPNECSVFHTMPVFKDESNTETDTICGIFSDDLGNSTSFMMFSFPPKMLPLFCILLLHNFSDRHLCNNFGNKENLRLNNVVRNLRICNFWLLRIAKSPIIVW